MVKSWKARQMVPGKDTLSTMAMHYGITSSLVREIIKAAGVEVVREDGFKGTLKTISTEERTIPSQRRRRVLGWSDGQTGVDPATTKLTRPAIMAVALWKFQNDEKGGDS